MFFAISKVLFSFVAPSNFCLLLIVGGLVLRFWARWHRLGLRLVVCGFCLLLVIGFSPLGKWLSMPLEERFVGVEPPPAGAITHIILLGGFEQAGVGNQRGQLSTNSAAERLLAIPVLARRYPAAKIVFTGGYGALIGEPINAVRGVQKYLIDAGIARERLVLEGRSRSTWENALFVKELLVADEGLCPCGHLLVTSSWHMPRSVGVFRKTGFDREGSKLYVWPVDYRTEGGLQIWMPFSWLYDGLLMTDQATKEWIGLFAYWMAGRTTELWPGPLETARQVGQKKNEQSE